MEGIMEENEARITRELIGKGKETERKWRKNRWKSDMEKNIKG